MRASSLSNKKIIDLLNRYFVPVTIDGVYLNQNAASQADEKKAYREVFQKFYQANKDAKDGQPKFSVGTVHAYILAPDGRAVDSLHVADAAQPAKLLEMLEKAREKLKAAAGEPLGKFTPLSAAPKIEADSLLLHLTARYLTAKNQANARKDIDDALVPMQASGLGNGQGGWHSLPSEDWLVLDKDDCTKLLPSGQVSAGKSWDIDSKVSEKILTRFYPTTELNDLAKNRLDKQSLRGTVIAVEKGIARARIDGTLKMKHPFYPNRDDENSVEATIVGVIEFATSATAQPRIRSMQLVTEKASYGDHAKKAQPFGVAVRSLP